jgi:glycerophosphoryl diester phosphodiesterase
VNAPDWLVAWPIAHRGLHDGARGIVENSLAAAEAAAAAGYSIECDVQATSDGVPVVFHDARLERLVAAQGAVADWRASALAQLAFRDGNGTVPTLAALLAKVAGRVPLIVEIKGGFDGDTRIVASIATLIAAYAGPLALKSFDPDILHACRAARLPRPIGLVAEARYAPADWPALSASQRQALESLAAFPRTDPDFLSWHVEDLPHGVPMLFRQGLGRPVMTWTVRDAARRRQALEWADQVVFEGFAP